MYVNIAHLREEQKSLPLLSPRGPPPTHVHFSSCPLCWKAHSHLLSLVPNEKFNLQLHPEDNCKVITTRQHTYVEEVSGLDEKPEAE